MTHPKTMTQSDDEADEKAETDARTVDVAVYYTTFEADAVSDETWETARDIRCFADPDDVRPETFDAYDRVAGGELSLSQLVDDDPSIRLVCDHIYSRLQGGRTDDELGYDGSEMRSAMIGDVIVVDGQASLVGEGCSFPDLGHIEWLTGERTVKHPDGGGSGSGNDSGVDRGEGLRCDGGGMGAKHILENIGVDTDQLDAFDGSDESTTDDAVDDRGETETTPPETETAGTEGDNPKTADDSDEAEAEDDRFPTVAELDSLRVEHGLSQREFSRRAGFEETRFSHIVSKNLNPTAETMQAFVAVLQETEPLTDADHATTRGPKPKPSDVVDRGDGIETDGGQPFVGSLQEARVGSSIIVTLSDPLTHNGVVYETARFVLEDSETVDLSYNPSTTAVSKLRVSGHIIDASGRVDGTIESWEVTSTKCRRGDWNAIEVCGYYYDREEGGYLDTETVGVASVTVATDCEAVDRGEGVRTDGGFDAIVADCPDCKFGNLKSEQAGIRGEEKILRCSFVECGRVVKSYHEDWPDHVQKSAELRTDGGEDRPRGLVDADTRWTTADAWAIRTDVCGVFCDSEPEVSFVDEWSIEVHWCRDCYEEPCGHCGEELRDENKRKGMCQDRRDEIDSWSGDERRGIQKDPDSEQTTLLTDGGLDTAPKQSTLPSTDTRTLGAKLYSEHVEGFGQKVHVAVYEQAVVVNPPSRFGDFEVYWPECPRVVGLYGLAALYWLRDQYEGCRDLLALRRKLGLCEVDCD